MALAHFNMVTVQCSHTHVFFTEKHFASCKRTMKTYFEQINFTLKYHTSSTNILFFFAKTKSFEQKMGTFPLNYKLARLFPPTLTNFVFLSLYAPVTRPPFYLLIGILTFCWQSKLMVHFLGSVCRIQDLLGLQQGLPLQQFLPGGF